jgi:hypothetical protein
MKIILSRKAFDSGSGGFPNPILPDGRLVPLPIPADADLQMFGGLTINDAPLGPLVEDLTASRIERTRHCHLDPDLDARTSARLPGWRPAFGQASTAQRHLSAHGVDRGDLFLFFGWFRALEQSAGKWRYVRGAPNLHVIFGWMRIGDVLDVRASADLGERLAPFADHPHIRRRDRRSNTLYLAADRLSLGDVEREGGGVFRTIADSRVLTDTRQSKRSVWSLPACFHPGAGATLSYHENLHRWSNGGEQCVLSSVARGQEFVLALPRPDSAEAWLRQVFADGAP